MAEKGGKAEQPREEAARLGGRRWVEVPAVSLASHLTLAAKGLAVLVIDMQRDFVNEGGKLFVGPSAPATVPRIRAVLDQARKAKVPVIYTQDWHPPDAKEFEIWGSHCVQNTTGAEIVDELAPIVHDIVVRKETYDPFYETDLDVKLSDLEVDRALIMGTVANICVLHAVAGVALRGIKPIVPTDCISSINEFDEAIAHRQTTFLYKGVLTTSDALKIL
ncbi:MAG: isochorismatase family cysteine hydrolase [Candidatus Bathyarchaeia archaeon]